MNTARLILVSAALTAAFSAFAEDNSKYLPRIEKGQLVNAQPVVKREPTPVEQTVTKIMTAPVAPTIVNGNLGVKVQGSFK